jgi:AcrR family transcriptional regulator
MTNREKILEKSIELFASKGYDAVGVQEIVDSVGVTKPTLYHYFGSKQGLLDMLLKEQFSLLEESSRVAMEYAGDITLTLQKITKVYFEFAQAHPAFYRLALILWFAPAESDGFRAVVPYNMRQQEKMEKIFLAAAKDHGNMKGRHQRYAATFLGMMNTYIALALNGYSELNDPLMRHAVHQFMHGIFS